VSTQTTTQIGDGLPAGEGVHPLRRLSADELRRAKAVLAEHGLVDGQTRFTYVGLEEPPKQQVLGFRPGDAVDRRVRAILLDASSGAASDVVASLTRGEVDSRRELDPARDGQPPVILSDLEDRD